MQRGRKVENAIDITEPITIMVNRCHFSTAKPRDPGNCLIQRAAIDQPGHPITKAVIHRNIAYFMFKGQSQWHRAQSSPSVRTTVATFDTHLQKAIKLGLVSFPETGIALTFHPPRKSIQLERLRSDEFKAVRKASALKNKDKPKRAYKRPDSLTLEGIRSSQGYRL